MTELHIDSKSRKFDRRNVLKSAAMLTAVPFIPAQAAERDDTRQLWDEWCNALIEYREACRESHAAYEALPDNWFYSRPGKDELWCTVKQINKHAASLPKKEADKFLREVMPGFKAKEKEMKAAKDAVGFEQKAARWEAVSEPVYELADAILKSTSTSPDALLRKLFIHSLFSTTNGDPLAFVMDDAIINALSELTAAERLV
ncbi:hypothetical protein [uncultured Sneathiella sp.]|uniref:hypothetical protein n=1 Tax=uncultured Sneathiella sp. TaxID=879315 RepID=UPI0030D6E424